MSSAIPRAEENEDTESDPTVEARKDSEMKLSDQKQTIKLFRG